MAKNIESLAKQLGATVVGTVPDYSAVEVSSSCLHSPLMSNGDLV